MRTSHITAEEIRGAVARVSSTAERLRTSSLEWRADALGAACAHLCSPSTRIGKEARATLPGSTGLSPAMVEWALATAVASADKDSLGRLCSSIEAAPLGRAIASPPRLVVVILAGNVFTAALRAISAPLLLGAPVVVKASSREEVFPTMLRQAVREIDRTMAESLEVLSFVGGEKEDREAALFSEADVVCAYGSDATLAGVQKALPATARLIPHGHGLGAAYVPQSALSDALSLSRVIREVALDVAAYDQRGCLSPHAVLVESGAVDARDFAEHLAHEGLAELARTYPRGPLPLAAGAAQLQWRAVATQQGELFEGDGFAASYEGSRTLRVSPGWRNVSVVSCEGVQDLISRLHVFGRHLKALGVAGDARARKEIARLLPHSLVPRLCETGQMQTPPFDAFADGDFLWSGLVRWVEY